MESEVIKEAESRVMASLHGVVSREMFEKRVKEVVETIKKGEKDVGKESCSAAAN